MSADNAFIAFTCISIAATLLAFVIGSAGWDRIRMKSALLNLVKSRKKEREQQLIRLTTMADEMREAREKGQSFGSMHPERI